MWAVFWFHDWRFYTDVIRLPAPHVPVKGCYSSLPGWIGLPLGNSTGPALKGGAFWLGYAKAQTYETKKGIPSQGKSLCELGGHFKPIRRIKLNEGNLMKVSRGEWNVGKELFGPFLVCSHTGHCQLIKRKWLFAPCCFFALGSIGIHCRFCALHWIVVLRPFVSQECVRRRKTVFCRFLGAYLRPHQRK